MISLIWASMIGVKVLFEKTCLTSSEIVIWGAFITTATSVPERSKLAIEQDYGTSVRLITLISVVMQVLSNKQWECVTKVNKMLQFCLCCLISGETPGVRLVLKHRLSSAAAHARMQRLCQYLFSMLQPERWPIVGRRPSRLLAVVLAVIMLVGFMGFPAAAEITDGSAETVMESVTTPSGLVYTDTVVGEGDSPSTGQLVTVHYRGTLENGSEFDSSYRRNQPFTFQIGVGQVIRGWDEGVATMRVGGKRSLVIPPDLAYGSRGAGGVIPPNATLNFDVELLAID